MRYQPLVRASLPAFYTPYRWLTTPPASEEPEVVSQPSIADDIVKLPHGEDCELEAFRALSGILRFQADTMPNVDSPEFPGCWASLYLLVVSAARSPSSVS